MDIKKHINNGIEGFQIFDDKGNEYFLTEATEELAIEKYNGIKYREANPPPPTYQELRAKEYPSTDELIVALWELIVEKRPETANELQAKREAVKQKYPKG